MKINTIFKYAFALAAASFCLLAISPQAAFAMSKCSKSNTPSGDAEQSMMQGTVDDDTDTAMPMKQYNERDEGSSCNKCNRCGKPACKPACPAPCGSCKEKPKCKSSCDKCSSSLEKGKK